MDSENIPLKMMIRKDYRLPCGFITWVALKPLLKLVHIFCNQLCSAYLVPYFLLFKNSLLAKLA